MSTEVRTYLLHRPGSANSPFSGLCSSFWRPRNLFTHRGILLKHKSCFSMRGTPNPPFQTPVLAFSFPFFASDLLSKMGLSPFELFCSAYSSKQIRIEHTIYHIFLLNTTTFVFRKCARAAHLSKQVHNCSGFGSHACSHVFQQEDDSLSDRESLDGDEESMQSSSSIKGPWQKQVRRGIRSQPI